MRDDRTRNDESVSGAMHRGEAAGTPGAPLPRTDAADTGVGDGGLDRARRSHEAGGVGDGLRTGGSAGTGSGHDPMPDELGGAQRPRRDPDEGNHGIAGGPAGGTGP